MSFDELKLTASSMFPAIDPAGGQAAIVRDLQFRAQQTARFAERQLNWDKATHLRLLTAEGQASEALKIVTRLSSEFEADRSHRRKMVGYLAAGFTLISFLIQLGVGIRNDMRAEERERLRDARELQLAVERARSRVPQVQP